MVNREQASVKTLLYASLFDAPLSLQELYRYCITSAPLTKNLIRKELLARKDVIYHDGCYALREQQNDIALRKQRVQHSVKKIADAQRIGQILSVLPTIELVGISGSVAAYNADEGDDIDLCIITSKGTVWITRVLVLLILQLLGRRRKRNTVDEKDTICANLLFDTTQISFPAEKQDLFTAHELAALYPVVVRNNVYQRLWKGNRWVHTYLANSEPYNDYKHIGRTTIDNIWQWLLRQLEPLAYQLQYFYMKRHITTESILKSYIAFYKLDYRSRILCDLDHKMRLRGLLTK